MPIVDDTPPELAERLAAVGDGKLDDLALLPNLFRSFAAHQIEANKQTQHARISITETLGQVADRLSDLAKQQIKIVENVSILASRVEMLEGALVTLDTNLRDIRKDLDHRVSELELRARDLMARILAVEGVTKLPAPMPLIPSGFRIYLVLFALCCGSAVMVVAMQWLVSLAR
jgi:hypothetical protein